MTLRPDPRPELNAAHSMDTCWFIVDANGDVFVMSTGEGGGLPSQIEPQAQAIYKLLELLDKDGGYSVDFEANNDLPFVYQRKQDPDVHKDRAGPRWADLPVDLRDQAGHLQVPVPLREAETVDLAKHLDPYSMQFWADLDEYAVEAQGYLVDEAGETAGTSENDLVWSLYLTYALRESDDNAEEGDVVGWRFPAPSAPGVETPSVKPRPAPPSSSAAGTGDGETPRSRPWWVRWFGLGR